VKLRAVVLLCALTNFSVLAGCTDELYRAVWDAGATGRPDATGSGGNTAQGGAPPVLDGGAPRDAVAGAGEAGRMIVDAAGDATADVPVDAASDAPVDATDEVAPPTPVELVGAPLVFAPTASSFGLNVVVSNGDPSELRARVRAPGAETWTDAALPELPAPDIAQWRCDGLSAGTLYEYEIVVAQNEAGRPLFSGTAMTQREPGERFAFAMLTDSHIAPRNEVPIDLQTNGFAEDTLLQVARDIREGHPDFIIHGGDMLDFHQFGFNLPPPDEFWTRMGYLNYRRLLADTLGEAAHFPVIGNWDGENGCYTAEEIDLSRTQRLLYLPGPEPTTYPQGGSAYEDYYAFTWGDALFVVLNVMSYTTTWHLLGTDPGVPDDWTLGDAQLTWLEQTLANATSRWRFLFIHHTVGGAAGDPANTAYGRGGGQAAYVGEQAVVHALMQQYAVQVFFYGHDHVFTDMVVDGIHYTLPGSAGAPWKFPDTTTGYGEYWTDSGHARVEVNPESVRVDFIAMGGAVICSYSLN